MNTITVSVIMAAYQDAKTVGRAIESVLEQKTDFDIEIIIADDASTDGTQEILINYWKKNKDKIRLMLRRKNLGATRNGFGELINARGKYIALLGSDDYWIDKYKLKKQVEYMETHLDCSGVFSKCKILDENGIRRKVDYWNLYGSKSNYVLKDFERGKLPGHTSSLLCRNVFYQEKQKYNFFYKIHNMVGDQTIYCILLSFGYLGFLNEEMSVWKWVIRKDGTNAASVAARENQAFIMWKYYCRLEYYMKKNLEKKVNLLYQRKKEIRKAYNRFLEKKSSENLYILLKICIMEYGFRFIKRMAIKATKD